MMSTAMPDSLVIMWKCLLATLYRHHGRTWTAHIIYRFKTDLYRLVLWRHWYESAWHIKSRIIL